MEACVNSIHLPCVGDALYSGTALTPSLFPLGRYFGVGRVKTFVASHPAMSLLPTWGCSCEPACRTRLACYTSLCSRLSALHTHAQRTITNTKWFDYKTIFEVRALTKRKPIKKSSFYIAQYPVRWAAQTAIHVWPSWQTCSFRHQLCLSVKHSSHAAITPTTESFTFPPLSIARY